MHSAKYTHWLGKEYKEPIYKRDEAVSNVTASHINVEIQRTLEVTSTILQLNKCISEISIGIIINIWRGMESKPTYFSTKGWIIR